MKEYELTKTDTIGKSTKDISTIDKFIQIFYQNEESLNRDWKEKSRPLGTANFNGL
jgi:hypothetical protein